MLPKAFAWLANEPGPKAVAALIAIYGLKEAPGDGRDNPQILEMARACGLETVYRHDSVPWCGLAQAWAELEAGRQPGPPGSSALSSQAWRLLGTEIALPELGDILVWEHLDHPWTGHVARYVGETATHYAALGGNQSDQVSIAFFPKSRTRTAGTDMAFRNARRPPYRVTPPNVRRIFVAPDGALVGSETR